MFRKEYEELGKLIRDGSVAAALELLGELDDEARDDAASDLGDWIRELLQLLCFRALDDNLPIHHNTGHPDNPWSYVRNQEIKTGAEIIADMNWKEDEYDRSLGWDEAQLRAEISGTWDVLMYDMAKRLLGFQGEIEDLEAKLDRPAIQRLALDLILEAHACDSEVEATRQEPRR